MADQFLRDTVQFLRDEAKRRIPDITNKLILPRYSQPGGYHPYRWLEVGALMAVLNVMFAKRTGGITPEITAPYYCTTALIEERFPLFWVAPDLAKAVVNIDPPPDLTLEEIVWPLPVLTFFMPEGMFFSGDEELVAITVAKSNPNQLRPSALGDDEMFPSVYHPDRFVSMWGMTINHKAVKEKTPEEMFGTWYMNDRYSGNLDQFINSRASYHEDLKTMAKIVFNLILIMQTRPELVDGRTVLNTVRDKHTKQPYPIYQPRWVGKRYQIRRERAEGTHGTHASPRAHWRRGHWRNQAVGPRTAPQHKRILIDPIWVAP